MQDNFNEQRKQKEAIEAKLLYETISEILVSCRKAKGIKYTDFCYENDIPMSTYNDIIKSKGNASFYKISQIVKGLELNFEQFGRLLDENLPKKFWDLE